MRSQNRECEVESRADFSYIRYSQCWEDTRVVLDALEVKEGDRCLSIASAGDNSLSLLTRAPEKVVALDLNPAQLALCALKIEAIKQLTREETMALLGYLPAIAARRLALYMTLEPALPESARLFFAGNQDLLVKGLAGSGKFERYFKIFRKYVLPLVHSKATVEELLEPKSQDQRSHFYRLRWNTFSWQLLVRTFFSNRVMGMLGRDPEFFKYVNRSLPDFLSNSIHRALVINDPSQNAYLRWILLGHYGEVLPHWLQEENYSKIKENIERITLVNASLEEYLDTNKDEHFDCFNLSDIFEYMSESGFSRLYKRLKDHANSGARFAYWNMLVPRSIDLLEHSIQDELKIVEAKEEAESLYLKNQTFFYTRFNKEVMAGC